MAINLTKKHRTFVEAYEGNNIEAMRIAGFTGADIYLENKANEFLHDPNIREAIRQRSLYTASLIKTIATRDERQALWTSIMRNEDPHFIPETNEKGVSKPPENLPLSMRLKASELLGKSETDFVEKIDVHHNLSISDVIKEAYTVSNESLADIEAQYELQYQSKKRLVDIEADSDESLSEDAPISLGAFI